jgi:hypothetical protein
MKAAKDQIIKFKSICGSSPRNNELAVVNKVFPGIHAGKDGYELIFRKDHITLGAHEDECFPAD